MRPSSPLLLALALSGCMMQEPAPAPPPSSPPTAQEHAIPVSEEVSAEWWAEFRGFNAVAPRFIGAGPEVCARPYPLEGSPLIAVADRHPLGSWRNPVRACRPAGQRAYLDRLRCADGTAPRHRRLGSIRAAGVFGRMVDLYAVACPGADPAELFLDLYHERREDRPVPGFSIVPAG